MPVYNEALTIKQIVDKVISAPVPKPFSKEIIIINDGSTDTTKEIIDTYASNSSVIIKHCQQNRGKTNAVRIGIKMAAGDLVVIQDADLEYDPQQFQKLMQPILNNETDVVYGSRFKGNVKNMHWVNNFANRISNFSFNLLNGTRLSDINTCYKIFPRRIIQELTIESEGFTFETEITTKLIRKGLRIIEVPIDYTARSKKAGKKITWKKALEMYLGIFRFRTH